MRNLPSVATGWLKSLKTIISVATDWLQNLKTIVFSWSPRFVTWSFFTYLKLNLGRTDGQCCTQQHSLNPLDAAYFYTWNAQLVGQKQFNKTCFFIISPYLSPTKLQKDSSGPKLNALPSEKNMTIQRFVPISEPLLYKMVADCLLIWMPLPVTGGWTA